MISENDVRSISAALDIPMTGIIAADPLEKFEKKLSERAFTPFCHIEPEKRVDFQQAYAQAKTVIVIGLPYALKKIKKSETAQNFRIASFCGDRDYHIRVKEKLEDLAVRLQKIEAFEYRIFVDNAQLIDRASAWQAGLGFFGKNNCLIHPLYGSAFVIGQMLVSVPIAHHPAIPMASRCGDCTLCLKACPNSALGKGFEFDADRCISYLTQKKKLTEDEKSLLKTFLYGCDFCQLVCPFNRDVMESENLSETEVDLSPDINEILAMGANDFKQRYGESPLFWRGLKVIRRNAEILAEK